MDKLFIADEKDVRDGYTMDVYFERTKKILESCGMSKTEVCAEITGSSLPRKWEWAVFCGLEEVMRLVEGLPISISAVPEGTIFRTRTADSVRVPLMNIFGAYADFGIMETAMLGMLCQPSGIATAAARTKIAAKNKTVLAFGNRRMHPAISGVLDRSSYIGGCDGVSSKIGGDIIGQEPIGTVPHTLMLLMGSNDAAFKAFDRVIEKEVPRIMLIDTFSDERAAALEACRSIKDLKGVRLDTPGSRRGNYKELINEVRWELDMNGHKDVDIIVSGGLDEVSISEIVDSGASGFGVGTSISNAPTLDLSMDIVEKDGNPISKRGKFGGRKHTYRCPQCFQMGVSLKSDDRIMCSCGCEMEAIETEIIRNGKRVGKERTPSQIRDYVLKQLNTIGEL
ncbi:MAG: nicotinate phosphoribosyltransferase [Candidatus Methanoplasma sp.]|jgi:nicotinate phosphoribosyltransferase|nr:nicotinate phosphoribosyltransferase [Candidatus Methanoplasma sp.]